MTKENIQPGPASRGASRRKSHSQPQRKILGIHFGAMASPLAVQLAGWGLNKEYIARWQKSADAATLLRLQGYLPEAAAKVAQKRIFRDIEAEAKRVLKAERSA